MLEPEQISPDFGLDGDIRPVADPGLINHTWTVGSPPKAILQWVHPIFDPRIHLDIEAVTGRLKQRGLVTPQLLETNRNELWLEDPEAGYWRAMTFIPGSTLHRLRGAATARQCGDLVGRFHAALVDWDYTFQAPSRNIHDTPQRFAELHGTLDEVEAHPLLTPVREVADHLLRQWQSWEGELDLPRRPCHGDLKISNLRFDSAGQRALCLLDLDTLGPQRLADEMGDAWRSWCNPHGEDDPEGCRFDLDIFRASVRPWLAASPHLTSEERRSLVGGIERICLELAARFLSDALRNTYFREDRQRYPEAGAHNLLRARGQLVLARSVRQQRSACEAIVGRP